MSDESTFRLRGARPFVVLGSARLSLPLCPAVPLAGGRGIARRRGRFAFTLIELLIVVAIIALLVSILLPSLSSARELAMTALCSSNQHQIYLAAAMYASDFDGHMGPTELFYYHPVYNPTSPPNPPPLAAKNLDNPHKSVPDFYCAMDYIALSDYTRDSTQYGNPLKVRGNPALTCPVAINNLGGNFFRVYTSGWGDVECHYFFSDLIFGYRTFVRDNTHGPYRPEELAAPADTFFAGDALAFSDTPYGVDYAFAANFSEGNVGERSTCFGVVTVWTGSWTDDPPTYHKFGPQGLYWDGHVENVQVPPPSQRNALRHCFRRDATP